jgi:hypothetical protein
VAAGTPTCPECERPIDWPEAEEEDEEPSFNLMSFMKTHKKAFMVGILFGPAIFAYLLSSAFDMLRTFGLLPRY